MELKPVAKRFILHWGEMGSKWGVNRTVSQIHALLYISGRPVHAEEISETLGVARSNVSNSLKELQNWQLIHIVHTMNDRRDHFETSTDVWELFRTVVRERKQREFDPTITVLRDCLASPDFAREEAGASWADEMLRLSPETLVKVMKLGAKVQKLVRGDGAKSKKVAADVE